MSRWGLARATSAVLLLYAFTYAACCYCYTCCSRHGWSHRCACVCAQRFGPDGSKDSKRFSFSEVLDVSGIVVDQVKEGCGR